MQNSMNDTWNDNSAFSTSGCLWNAGDTIWCCHSMISATGQQNNHGIWSLKSWLSNECWIASSTVFVSMSTKTLSASLLFSTVWQRTEILSLKVLAAQSDTLAFGVWIPNFGDMESILWTQFEFKALNFKSFEDLSLNQSWTYYEAFKAIQAIVMSTLGLLQQVLLEWNTSNDCSDQALSSKIFRSSVRLCASGMASRWATGIAIHLLSLAGLLTDSLSKYHRYTCSILVWICFVCPFKSTNRFPLKSKRKGRESPLSFHRPSSNAIWER